MIKNLVSFRIVPDHEKIFFVQINIGDPPPQYTVLGVKKIFPELFISNIDTFLSEYCKTTFI